MAGFPKAGEEYGGRYRIVRQIGSGGMGSVYEAVDKVLNRSVALKIVLPSLPEREDYQARFAREASVLARIRSRHIVGIHEYGEHDDTVFFVTELFPDGDLQTWLAKNGPLDRRQSLMLVAQVCEALADAHASDVVHRDVKPANVLLWSRAEGLIPYLCDFGIATTEGQKGLTRTGTLVGSPAYMAPERHFGHVADERGDLYSVGCLLWAVLTGDAPYSGTDFQMMNSHINEPTPELGTGHAIDDRIDEVLARALQKDPERRIASAAEMRQELLDIVAELDGRGTPMPPPEPVTPRRPTPATDEGTRAAALPASAAVAARKESKGGRAAKEPQEPVTPPAPVEEQRPEAPPPVVPVAGPSTVIRNLPPPPPDGPVAVPARAAADPPRSRRRGPWVAAVVLVLLVVGGTAVAIGTGGDDDPSATDDPTTSAGTTTEASESATTDTTPPPLAAPRAPTLKASPAYRAVAFAVGAPKESSDVDQVVELKRDGTWTEARRDQVSVPTDQGGDRACLTARTVVTDAGGGTATSKPTRECGRAEARTVRFIRTGDPCVNSVGGSCTWYDVRVTGFADGVSPLVKVIRPDGSSFCAPYTCDFDAVRVGDHGRGYLRHDWKISRNEGVVIVDVDGARTRARVYH